MPRLATKLVNANVDVIVATTAQAVRAAQRATTSIPIVMAVSGNPVSQKLIPSLSNPVGNTTRASTADFARWPKQLEYLSMVMPGLKRVAHINSRSTPYGAGEFDDQVSVATGDGIETLANQFNATAGELRESAVKSERIGRLKRFLAPQVAELIEDAGNEKLLEGKRRCCCYFR